MSWKLVEAEIRSDFGKRLAIRCDAQIKVTSAGDVKVDESQPGVFETKPGRMYRINRLTSYQH